MVHQDMRMSKLEHMTTHESTQNTRKYQNYGVN